MLGQEKLAKLRSVALAAIFSAGILSVQGTNAFADTIVGGITFQDNAFVDALLSSSGSFTTEGGSLSAVLTDTSAATYAFSFDAGAFLNLGFTDNVVVNAVGNDLALFELGIPDAFNVTINGTTQTYLPTDTGTSAGGFSLNVALVDLSAFGLSAGATINALRLSFVATGTVASTALVGALNSADVGVPPPVPLPGALVLMGTVLAGGAGFAGFRKRAQRQAATA